MNPDITTKIKTNLQKGDISNSLIELKHSIRAAPSELEPRILYFQILCLTGQWENASNQLVTISELSARQSTLPIIYNSVLQSEIIRSLIFRSQREPTLMGEPQPWLALIIQSLKYFLTSQYELASRLQSQAFEEAPALAGQINGEPFEWLADADSRFGPIFEIIHNGDYYLVPQSAIDSIEIHEPTDLRDLVWASAALQLTNGGNLPVFLPVRYPGTELSKNDQHLLSRLTEWEEKSNGYYIGVGQRMWTTNQKDYSLLDVRSIVFSR